MELGQAVAAQGVTARKGQGRAERERTLRTLDQADQGTRIRVRIQGERERRMLLSLSKTVAHQSDGDRPGLSNDGKGVVVCA